MLTEHSVLLQVFYRLLLFTRYLPWWRPLSSQL